MSPMPRHRTRSCGAVGFSFVEILLGLVILILGLIPLMLTYSASTKETRVSIQQIQAINHASNLMEALRAFGAADFRNLLEFPSAMEQRKGGENKWAEATEPAAAPAGRTPAPGAAPAPPSGQGAAQGEANFQKFKEQFFSDNDPIVATLERQFRRVFRVEQRARGLITVIVQVSWDETDPTATQGARERTIDLRTVIADPYDFGSVVDRGSGDGSLDGAAAAPSRPRGPPAPGLPPGTAPIRPPDALGPNAASTSSRGALAIPGIGNRTSSTGQGR